MGFVIIIGESIFSDAPFRQTHNSVESPICEVYMSVVNTNAIYAQRKNGEKNGADSDQPTCDNRQREDLYIYIYNLYNHRPLSS